MQLRKEILKKTQAYQDSTPDPHDTYPGYQRFFSRAAEILGVGRRPTHLRP